MSCCGQKRMAFKQELENSAHYEAENSPEFQPETEKQPRVFEYIGNGKLSLRGTSTGALYYFRFPGERLEVNYYDSFAMMAERDLKTAS
jgi:hypothetical protein